MNKLLTKLYTVMQYREGLKLTKEQISLTTFGLKVGVAAVVCYYSAEQGVWSESTETTKLYNKICNTVSPLLKEATSQVPIEMPALPDSQRVAYLSKQYWNIGIMKTFDFLGNLPGHVTDWTNSGVNSLIENPEIRKFVESFGAPPSPSPAALPPVAE